MDTVLSAKGQREGKLHDVGRNICQKGKSGARSLFKSTAVYGIVPAQINAVHPTKRKFPQKDPVISGKYIQIG